MLQKLKNFFFRSYPDNQSHLVESDFVIMGLDPSESRLESTSLKSFEERDSSITQYNSAPLYVATTLLKIAGKSLFYILPVMISVGSWTPTIYALYTLYKISTPTLIITPIKILYNVFTMI